MRAIVDASSLLIMVKHSDEKELVRKLRDLATLDLTVYEVGNGLWRWISATMGMNHEEAERLLRALLNIFSMPTFTVVSWRDLDYTSTLRLAVQKKISFYDASYVEACIKLKKPLVTEDEKLRQAATELTQVLSWREV